MSKCMTHELSILSIVNIFISFGHYSEIMPYKLSIYHTYFLWKLCRNYATQIINFSYFFSFGNFVGIMPYKLSILLYLFSFELFGVVIANIFYYIFIIFLSKIYFVNCLKKAENLLQIFIYFF